MSEEFVNPNSMRVGEYARLRGVPVVEIRQLFSTDRNQMPLLSKDGMVVVSGRNKIPRLLSQAHINDTWDDWFYKA